MAEVAAMAAEVAAMAAAEVVAAVVVAEEDAAAAATRPAPYPFRLKFSFDGTLNRVPSCFGVLIAAGAVGQTIDNPFRGLQVCY